MTSASPARRQRGAETVEFLLTLLLFLLVFLMVIEFSLLSYDRTVVHHAGRIGARQASLYWVNPAQFNPEAPAENRRLKRAMVDSVVTWADQRLLLAANDDALALTLTVNGAPLGNVEDTVIASDALVGVALAYPHDYLLIGGWINSDGPLIRSAFAAEVE